MSNITLFGGAAVPAFARGAALSETTLALVGGMSSGKRISIKGGVFRLVAGGKEVAQIEERHLDVIVIKAAPKVSRVWYAAKYDGEAAPTAPDCWSADGETSDPSSKDRQSVHCAKCEKNIAGSGQGNSRACRYQQRLAVLVADDLDAGVHQLILPATSIFGKEDGENMPLQAYARKLAVQTQPIDVGMVVTRMKFDTKAESPKLFFKAMRWLTDTEFAAATEAAASTEATQAVVMMAQAKGSSPALALQGEPPKAAATEEAEEAIAAVQAESKSVQKRKAAQQAEEDEPAVEPAKRKAASKASDSVPEKKSNLASIVGDWDDE
jgi:hypothetical protein